MRFHLSNSAFLGNIDPTIRLFDPRNKTELIITANEKWVSVHPVILAMLATLGEEISQEKIIWKEEYRQAKSIHYLQRMGLFNILKIKEEKIITKHEPAGRFIPLTKISSAAEQSQFISEMIPLLHLEFEQVEPIKYVVSELIRNVLEHAESKKGAWVCAQFYPKSNRVRIGIVDTGIGIKESISRSILTINDSQAIRLALMPGVSGSNDPDNNAGAGLFFTRCIAKTNKDFFFIYSGKANYKLLISKDKRLEFETDPWNEDNSNNDNLPYWQGTVVGIDFTLKKTTEFSELMQKLRETYTEKLREKKKLVKMRPQFT
jgi:anti-sigma regulatory factor (Ser/Thr protein kinase)